MLDLNVRTKTFALRIIRLYGALPKTASAQMLGKQLFRSGTSVGAHYREASHARSRAELISKMEVGQQELEETRYWFELLVESEIVSAQKLKPLRDEADELMAIFTASIKKIKANKKAK
jgi:four helix bundle protein